MDALSANPAEMSRRRLESVALVAVVLVTAVLTLWVVPAWITQEPRVMGIERHNAVNDARLSVIAALAVAGTASGVWFTGRTYALGKRTHVAERYAKAVEQLGHANTSVQIGGIYALELIALDYPDYLPTAIDIVAAYARDISPATPAPAASAATRRPKQSLAISVSVVRKLLALIQKRQLDLSETDLAAMDFTDANLVDAKFFGARLEGTYFSSADIRGADFRNAVLDERTRFYNAKVAGARFDRTEATETLLRNANVEGFAELQWN